MISDVNTILNFILLEMPPWLVPSQDNTFIHYLSSKHEGRSVVSGWPLTLLTSLTLGITMCTVVYIDNRAIMVFIRFCDFWTLETSS